jgi:hypothetical protein
VTDQRRNLGASGVGRLDQRVEERSGRRKRGGSEMVAGVSVIATENEATAVIVSGGKEEMIEIGGAVEIAQMRTGIRVGRGRNEILRINSMVIPSGCADDSKESGK